MLENLSDVDQIGLGIAVENHELVEKAARSLGRRAERTMKIDIKIFGLDAARDPQFDAYLTVQAQAAAAIASAAQQQDVRSALRGMRQLIRSACMACHQDFRESANLLRPSVLFMTNFLNAWREIIRGLAINDFSLVERQAREIESVERSLNQEPVIGKVFGPRNPQDRELLRSYLRHVSLKAAEIQRAAAEEDAAGVTQAVQEMWEGGCISCHEEFR